MCSLFCDVTWHTLVGPISKGQAARNLFHVTPQKTEDILLFQLASTVSLRLQTLYYVGSPDQNLILPRMPAPCRCLMMFYKKI
jgi:hypothetical protein